MTINVITLIYIGLIVLSHKGELREEITKYFETRHTAKTAVVKRRQTQEKIVQMIKTNERHSYPHFATSFEISTRTEQD